MACISLAILAICLEITGVAALTAFGGIASKPVAFLGSSGFIHFDSVTGENSKSDSFAFSLIFIMLGCSSLLVCHNQYQYLCYVDIN